MRSLRRRFLRRPSQRDARTVRAALDFGASGARALIVRLQPGGVEILGHGEAAGPSAVARPGHVMQRERIAALAEQALTAAERSSAPGGELPWIADDALVMLGGPLLVAHSHVEHLARAEPLAPIFEEELKSALASAQRAALGALAAREASGPIGRTLVGSELVGAMSVRIDTLRAERLTEVTRGVPGHAGDFLSVALCNLTWPTKGLDMLARLLDDAELRLRAVVPTARAVAAALPRSDAILLEVGYDHTELALVEGGALSALRSLPIGSVHFTRALMSRLSIHEKHAELLKRQHVQGRAPGGRGPVPRLLKAGTAPWLLAVDEALGEVAGEGPLPSRFYLFGGGSLIPELLDGARRHPWVQTHAFTEAPTVEWLYPATLRGVSDPRGLLGSPAQVGLAALAAWAARDPSPLQREVARLTPALAREAGLGGVFGGLE